METKIETREDQGLLTTLCLFPFHCHDAIRNMRYASSESPTRPSRRAAATKQPAVISRLLYFLATAHRTATRVHRRQDVVRRGACNYAI